MNTIFSSSFLGVILMLVKDMPKYFSEIETGLCNKCRKNCKSALNDFKFCYKQGDVKVIINSKRIYELLEKEVKYAVAACRANHLFKLFEIRAEQIMRNGEAENFEKLKTALERVEKAYRLNAAFSKKSDDFANVRNEIIVKNINIIRRVIEIVSR